MRPRAIVIGLVGGSLLAFSFVVPEAWMMNVVAVAAFLWVQRDDFGTRASGTLAFAWTAFVGGYHWLQPTLVALWGGRVGLSWLVFLGLAAWFAIRFLLVAWGFCALERRGARPMLALTAPWVTVEWLFPTLFPFYLGSPWVDLPDWAALASLGGPLLLSAVLCIVGVAIGELGRAGFERRAADRASLGFAVGTIAVSIGSGMASNARVTHAIDHAVPLTVGVVQQNVDVTGDRTARALTHRRYLNASEDLEASTRALDLIVWPETAYAVPMVERLPTSGAIVRGALRTPLLFGGIVESTSGERWNSALLVDADGKVRSSYHKQHLIPFAEFVPMSGLFSAFDVSAPSRSRFERGPETEGVQLGVHRVATPICYEAIRPNYVRRLVRDTQATLIVTMANDGWFGDSAEPRIHLMLARMRAVEHRRYLVRATNTGISAIVDPFGRITEVASLSKSVDLVGEVRALDVRTTYQVLGNWPGPVAVAWVFVWLGWRRRRG